MNVPFFGEVLILVLLIINSSRMFFLKYGKIDALTVLAPVSVVLSILQIVAWNIDVFSILILAVSLFAFFVNFRALLRFASGLYVDHYSAAFKIGAFFELLSSAAILAFLIYFCPAIIRPSDYAVTETKIRLSGSFSGGFHTAAFFEHADGIMTVVRPDETENVRKTAVILVPDKRADTYQYLPLLYMIAQNGYTVYSADFFARDMKWFHSAADIRMFRRFSFICAYLKNTFRFESEKEFYAFNTSREISAAVDFIRGTEPPETSVFLIGDWMAETALSDFAKLHADSVAGILNLCDFEEYKTPGFGFVRQREPLTAYCIASEKNTDAGEIQLLAEKIMAVLPSEQKAEYEANMTEENSNDAE